MSFVDAMIDVKRGREPSMYVDIQSDGLRVLTPKSTVRPSAAENCVRLAHAVLLQAEPHVTQSVPKVTTRAEDTLFTLKPAYYQKMINTADFWWYYISRMESGDTAFEIAVTEYDKKYFSKNITFKNEADHE